MTNIDTAGLIPMFFYGSLRPNPDDSWGMTGDEPIIRNAYISGRLWFVSGGWGYPVAKLDRLGRIIGDIVFYEPNSALYHRICDVETGAGYEMREVEATYISTEEEIDNFIATGEFQRITVNAWHWNGDVRKRTPVPDNDWLRASNRSRADR